MYRTNKMLDTRLSLLAKTGYLLLYKKTPLYNIILQGGDKKHEGKCKIMYEFDGCDHVTGDVYS